MADRDFDLHRRRFLRPEGTAAIEIKVSSEDGEDGMIAADIAVTDCVGDQVTIDFHVFRYETPERRAEAVQEAVDEIGALIEDLADVRTAILNAHEKQNKARRKNG